MKAIHERLTETVYITRYEREHWTEWFRIVVEEGVYRSYYLPVERLQTSYQKVCWLWYLAPFVVLIKLFSVAFMATYKDLIKTLRDWKEIENNKK